MPDVGDVSPETSLQSQTRPQQTRSEQIREIVSRQDSFDKSITFPSQKHGSQSPDIATNKISLVTPDELFGPVSPRKGDHARDNGIDKTHETCKDMLRNSETAEEGISFQDTNRKKVPLPRDGNMLSNLSDSETPLKSYSRFETGAKNRIRNADSHKNNVSDIDNNHNQLRMYSNSSNKYGDIFDKASSVNANKNRDRSRFHGDWGSENGSPSGTSYNHGHIFDDNLHISDPQLDTTLLRFFSRNSSHQKGDDSDYNNNAGLQQSYSHNDFIGMEPVMWRVHPMIATHKETLDREMDFIAFHVKPRDIISQLYKDGVLTPMDYNQLSRTEGQGDKAVTRLMIRTLQRRGSKAYPALINALLASDYFLVCERLSQSEQGLQSGLFTDRAESEWRRKRANMPTWSDMNYTPYKRLTPVFTNETPAFAFPTMLSPNQYFPGVETWPLANHGSLPDHVSPFHNTMPASSRMTPVEALVTDFQISGPLRLEQRLGDLDDRLIRQNIASLKTATQRSSPDHVMSSMSVPTRDRVPAKNADQVTDTHYLEQQLNDLKTRLTELIEFVAALEPERSNVTRLDNGPKRLMQDKRDHISSNQRTRSDRQATPPTYHEGSYRYDLEQQMRELKIKLLELHEDVLALKAATPQSHRPQMGNQPPHSSYWRQQESTDSHRGLDVDKLDVHLRALRAEINMLHNDVTALKIARSSSSLADRGPTSTSMTTRTHSQRSLGDRLYDTDTHLSPVKIPSMGAYRQKADFSNFNVVPGPTHHPSFPRYPSRYSPRDIHNGRDMDTGRSVSRSESRTSGPGDRRKTIGTKSSIRNVDKRNEKNRNSMNKEDSKSYKDNNDWFFSKEDEIYFEEKDEFNRHIKKKLNKGESPNTEVNGSSRKHNSQVHKENVKHDDNISHAKEKDYSASRSVGSQLLDNRHDKSASNQRNGSPQTDTDRNLGNAGTDNGYNKRVTRRESTEDNPREGHNKHGKTVPAPSGNDKPPSKLQQPPIPTIVTPDERLHGPEERLADSKNNLGVPGQTPQPKEKKRVRYNNPAPEAEHDNERFNQTRPKSRAAHTTNRRRSNEIEDRNNRPSSPADSLASEGSEYVRVTTPTRILSPPLDIPYERVTTPYKILRNPNSRKMTTWSKRTDKKRNTTVT